MAVSESPQSRMRLCRRSAAVGSAFCRIGLSASLSPAKCPFSFGLCALDVKWGNAPRDDSRCLES